MGDLTFPDTFPVLETERLILREITESDTRAIFKNFSDPEVAKWFFEQPLTNMEQASEFIRAFQRDFEQREGITWAIVLKDEGECIGTCGYGSVEVGSRGEMGFDLAKEHWGKGMMTEALSAVINYGFESLGLSKVEAHSYSTNVRAIGLLKKMGFMVDKITDEDSYFCLEGDSWTG